MIIRRLIITFTVEFCSQISSGKPEDECWSTTIESEKSEPEENITVSQGLLLLFVAPLLLLLLLSLSLSLSSSLSCLPPSLPPPPLSLSEIETQEAKKRELNTYSLLGSFCFCQ